MLHRGQGALRAPVKRGGGVQPPPTRSGAEFLEEPKVQTEIFGLNSLAPKRG